jgi:hypothetical protein
MSKVTVRLEKLADKFEWKLNKSAQMGGAVPLQDNGPSDVSQVEFDINSVNGFTTKDNTAKAQKIVGDNIGDYNGIVKAEIVVNTIPEKGPPAFNFVTTFTPPNDQYKKACEKALTDAFGQVMAVRLKNQAPPKQVYRGSWFSLNYS